MNSYFTVSINARKMKFFIKDFFSKFDQSRNFQRIWPHLRKKSLMENLIFVQYIASNPQIQMLEKLLKKIFFVAFLESAETATGGVLYKKGVLKIFQS